MYVLMEMSRTATEVEIPLLVRRIVTAGDKRCIRTFVMGAHIFSKNCYTGHVPHDGHIECLEYRQSYIKRMKR